MTMLASLCTPLLASFVVAAAPRASAAQCPPERVSEPSAGGEGNDSSYDAVASDDGRFVAFTSRARNLVSPSSPSFWQDVFVADRALGTIVQVSVDHLGQEGNEHSTQPEISADGRYVAFLSSASNLVPGDTNGERDAFVRDLQTSTTTRVSVSTLGQEPNDSCGFLDLSADGRFAVFWSTATNLVPNDANGWDDVFLRDLANGVTERISVGLGGLEGDGPSASPSVSEDGRYVAFHSKATNLVAGDLNGVQDCFVRDRLLGTTIVVSVPSGGGWTSSGTSQPEISGDGTTVAFWTGGSDLVANDTNNSWDVFVRHVPTGTTKRVSVASDGTQGAGDSSSGYPSADGRYITFSSVAIGLDPNDQNFYWDAYVHDRTTGDTRLVTLSSVGLPADGDSWATSATIPDGRLVPVESQASNLVPNDLNNRTDTFVFDCTSFSVTTYCTAKVNSLLCLPSVEGIGFASATDPAPFDVRATQVINNRLGLLFYGPSPDAKVFQGGFKCVDSPVRRLPLQDSGGNPSPPDCSGVYSTDFNARIQSGVDASLVAGAVVYCQYWYRDPASASGTGLSDGLRMTILP